MHVCPHCAGAMCYPVSWHATQRAYWVSMRCPDCEHRWRGIYSRRETDALDCELDRASATLLRNLRTITAQNMREEADALAIALAVDGIMPADF